MRPGPSIALEFLAGSASLALSVRGWHGPEMAVLGAGLFVRAGFDLERKRPTNRPPIPRHHAPVLPPAGPARSGGRAAWSEGAYRVAAWATRDRGIDPAQVRLDRDWLAAQRQRTSATAAVSASPGGQGNDDPPSRPQQEHGRGERTRPSLAHQPQRGPDAPAN
jgi:hypothetical protein